MFGSLGPLELMVIFIIVLIVFGADRLPELARGLGKGIREFKRAADEVKSEIMIDTDLNLDLNSPLPSETDKAEDPYKMDDWETDKLESSEEITTEQNGLSDHVGGNDEEQSEKRTEKKESKKEQPAKKNKTDTNNKYEKSNSEKPSLLG